MPALKYKKKTYAGATFPVLEMTKAEYDALPSSKQNDGTVYLITDDDGGWEAERSTYDNTESGLTATNVQAALDEIITNSVKKREFSATVGSNGSFAFPTDISTGRRVISCFLADTVSSNRAVRLDTYGQNTYGHLYNSTEGSGSAVSGTFNFIAYYV